MRIADWILVALILTAAFWKGGGIDPSVEPPNGEVIQPWVNKSSGGTGAGAEG